MGRLKDKQQFKRILVRCPNWIGDAVMATPFLSILREEYPKAHITLMLREYTQQVFFGSPYYDDMILIPNEAKKSPFREKIRYCRLNIQKIREGKYDCGLLLSNSFEAALETFAAGVPYRIGYKRDGRNLFLTDGPVPLRVNGKYAPVPMIEYYNGLLPYVNIMSSKDEMRLYISEDEKNAAEPVLKELNILPGDMIIGLNPGGAFGASKFWLPEYFAKVGDHFAAQKGVKVLLLAGPNEVPIAEKIAGMMHHDAIISTPEKVTISILKVLIKRMSLLVTNDTGPRHFATAFGVPSIVIIGSTNPKWTENSDPYQLVIHRIPHCGPCHLKVCPLNHQCMKSIKPETVIHAAEKLLQVVTHE